MLRRVSSVSDILHTFLRELMKLRLREGACRDRATTEAADESEEVNGVTVAVGVVHDCNEANE